MQQLELVRVYLHEAADGEDRKRRRLEREEHDERKEGERDQPESRARGPPRLGDVVRRGLVDLDRACAFRKRASEVPGARVRVDVVVADDAEHRDERANNGDAKYLGVARPDDAAPARGIRVGELSLLGAPRADDRPSDRPLRPRRPEEAASETEVVCYGVEDGESYEHEP